MKKTITQFLILIISVCLIVSCKKQLNVFPTTSEVDGNVIVDVNSARAVLNGVYSRFSNAGFDFEFNVPQIQWTDMQESKPSELSGMQTEPYGGTDFANHRYDRTSDEAYDIWVYEYNIINSANGFIKNIEPVTGIDKSIKDKMLAEAKFLRAFANANLLLYFGQYNDVPSKYGNLLRTEFVTPDNIILPRSSVAETYDSIFADLDNAIAYLPNSNINVEANVWAAKLLKARVLINRNTPGDAEEVIKLTKDIIANSPFSLEGNVKDIFLQNGLNSNEVILGIEPYNNQVYKYNSYIEYTEFISTDEFVKLFKKDPRKSWMYQGYDYYGDGDSVNVITKYYPGDINNKKFTAITEYAYAFRLTEAYLLQAEAIVASGGNMSEAKSLLKTVLKHAGFTTFSDVDAANTPSQLQLLIIEEEMKNFVAEAGEDWFAVRRLPFTTLQSLVPTFVNKANLILPIPQLEIIANSKIEQNPGY